MDSQVFAISKETMEGSGEGLMDHIAECLATFAKGRKISKAIFLPSILLKKQTKILPNSSPKGYKMCQIIKKCTTETTFLV